MSISITDKQPETPNLRVVPDLPPAAVTLPKAVMRAILQFASTDFTRPHLACVHFDASGAIVATDGHTMVVYPCAAFGGESFTVDARAFKAMAKGRGEITVTRDELSDDGGVRAPASKISHGMFPPWQAVVPDKASYDTMPRADALAEERATEVGVNGHYMKRLAALQDACGADGFAMRTRGKLDPIRCDLMNEAACAIVMPMRLSDARR